MSTIDKIKKLGYKISIVSTWRNGMQVIDGWHLKRDNGICRDEDLGFFPSPTQALNRIQGRDYKRGLKYSN